jgi:hypothetical protein
MKPKFQKRSALKFVGRTIPRKQRIVRLAENERCEERWSKKRLKNNNISGKSFSINM